ncbi:hypothetical protein ACFLY9_01830 [Patescibacteria group bacterium]
MNVVAPNPQYSGPRGEIPILRREGGEEMVVSNTTMRLALGALTGILLLGAAGLNQIRLDTPEMINSNVPAVQLLRREELQKDQPRVVNIHTDGSASWDQSTPTWP